MNKTRKNFIKDEYGYKKFISQDKLFAIRFLDNGGIPNNKLKKKEKKEAILEYKRRTILLIDWFSKKSISLKRKIKKKFKIKGKLKSGLNKYKWKKLKEIHDFCLEHQSKNKTRKL